MLAHGVGGDLPLPSWLFAYGAGAAVLVAAFALGATWLRPRLARAATGGTSLGSWTAVVATAGWWLLRGLGLAVYVVVLVAALWGENDSFTNITPYAAYTLFWVGGVVVSASVGPVWRAVNPLDSLATVVFGRRLPDRTRRADPGLWPAAFLVASFLWLDLAYHDPASPRALGTWIVAYTVAALLGAAVWGRSWLRRSEGFAALFGLLAAMSPLWRDDRGELRLRWPLSGLSGVEARPGLDAMLFTVVGALLFDAVASLDWWVRDVVGARSAWGRTLVDTVGLLFAISVVAAVWNAAGRLAGGATTVLRYLPALVPVIVGGIVAHRFTTTVYDAYNLVALASDPLGRGWDLFGTIDIYPRFQLSPDLVAWVAAVAMTIGHVAAVVVVHDRSLEAHESPRAAGHDRWPFAGALVVSVVAMLLLTLTA